MRDEPNLDYEPGPAEASHSRLGPPVAPAGIGAGAALSGLDPAASVNYEFSTELAPDLGPAPRQRRVRRENRRRHKYVRD